MDIYAALAVFWATFLAGMGYSYELYYKARKKEGEDFEWSKMRRTAVVSIVLGLTTAGVSYWRGIGLEDAELWLSTSGAMGFIIMLVDQAIAIYLKEPAPPPAPTPDPDIEAAITNQDNDKTRGGG
jgi:hypothetical protein